MKKRSYFGSVLIITVTLVLFAIALYTKGFTHDLLLEAGVFLVSVKLILLSYQQTTATDSLEKKLDAIYERLNPPQDLTDK
ncbi:MAG: hypothetical protein U1F57_03360 [bacterium]